MRKKHARSVSGIEDLKELNDDIKSIDTIPADANVHQLSMNDLVAKYRRIEEENRKLKQMYADLALDNKILKDILGNRA